MEELDYLPQICRTLGIKQGCTRKLYIHLEVAFTWLIDLQNMLLFAICYFWLLCTGFFKACP